MGVRSRTNPGSTSSPESVGGWSKEKLRVSASIVRPTAGGTFRVRVSIGNAIANRVNFYYEWIAYPPSVWY